MWDYEGKVSIYLTSHFIRSSLSFIPKNSILLKNKFDMYVYLRNTPLDPPKHIKFQFQHSTYINTWPTHNNLK